MVLIMVRHKNIAVLELHTELNKDNLLLKAGKSDNCKRTKEKKKEKICLQSPDNARIKDSLVR